jgi:hypothetical protein
VRGPKRIAFPAGRGGASGPAGRPGALLARPGVLLARTAAEMVVSGWRGADIAIPPRRPRLPAVPVRTNLLATM